MAGNTFEERLTRLEEQLEALQALARGLAAWELGAESPPEPDREVRSAGPNHARTNGRQSDPRART